MQPPKPSNEEVRVYLSHWDSLENYKLQENALDELFFNTFPYNKDINHILIKVASLNDFYSTHILSVFAVAKHIYELDIDSRLSRGDVTLVNDIAQCEINGKDINFYSFATKYCSHHKPLEYPIYDWYVDKVVHYFNGKDNFEFKNANLREYRNFKDVLLAFKYHYNLECNLKDLDRYLWQLGKDYFPKKYKRGK